MTQAELNQDLINFLEKLNNLPSGTINSSTKLIEEGHIDSFSIMQLILFIEENYGISIAIDSLPLETINTVDIIVDNYALRAGVEK